MRWNNLKLIIRRAAKIVKNTTEERNKPNLGQFVTLI